MTPFSADGCPFMKISRVCALSISASLLASQFSFADTQSGAVTFKRAISSSEKTQIESTFRLQLTLNRQSTEASVLGEASDLLHFTASSTLIAKTYFGGNDAFIPTLNLEPVNAFYADNGSSPYIGFNADGSSLFFERSGLADLKVSGKRLTAVYGNRSSTLTFEANVLSVKYVGSSLFGDREPGYEGACTAKDLLLEVSTADGGFTYIQAGAFSYSAPMSNAVYLSLRPEVINGSIHFGTCANVTGPGGNGG